MKTLIIYNEVPDKLPQFLIVDGDYSRFNGVRFNIDHHEFEEECNDFLFEQETGNMKLTFSNDISVVESKDFDKVAMITFFC